MQTANTILEGLRGMKERSRIATVKDLTRHKISDRWRGRVWLQFECGSHRKLERGTASGSLHRLVRCCGHFSKRFISMSSNEPILWNVGAYVSHNSFVVPAIETTAISRSLLPQNSEYKM